MKKAIEEAVEEAVAKVSAQAEEYVDSEMETHTKRATKAAAYSGLAQLTLMSLEQRRAYNIFAPHIAAGPCFGRLSSFPYTPVLYLHTFNVIDSNLSLICSVQERIRPADPLKFIYERDSIATDSPPPHPWVLTPELRHGKVAGNRSTHCAREMSNITRA